MENGIYYSIKNNKCVFKLVGAIRYSACGAFNKVIEQQFLDDNINFFIIDLSSTSYIDSTNLGMIAKISRYTYDKKYDKPVLICPKNDIYTLIKSMGFERVFTIVHDFNIDINTSHHLQSEMAEKKIIIEAHEILMDMNENNYKTFKNVVELMKK